MNKRGNEVTMRERGEIEGDIKKDGKKKRPLKYTMA